MANLKNEFSFLISLAGFLMSVFLISGCGSQSTQSTTQVATGAKKIVVWHWMTDRDNAFLELAKQYEVKTGIKVVFELYAPSDAYTQKVRAAAQALSLPDIFGLLGEKRDFASPLVENAISAPLNGVFECNIPP